MTAPEGRERTRLHGRRHAAARSGGGRFRSRRAHRYRRRLQGGTAGDSRRGRAGATVKMIAGQSGLNVVAVGDLNGDGWLDVAAASTSGNDVAVYFGGMSGPAFVRCAPSDRRRAGSRSARERRWPPRHHHGGPRSSTGQPAGRRSRAPRPLLNTPGDRRRPRQPGPGDRRFRRRRPNRCSHRMIRGRRHGPLQHDHIPQSGVQLQHADAAEQRASRGRRCGALPVFAVAQIAAADFNRDGQIDFVVPGGSTTSSNAALVLLRDGPVVTLSGPAPLTRFLVADFNGDGNPDVLYYFERFRRTAARDSLRRLPRGWPWSFHGIGGDSRGERAAMVRAGDLNGDARADYVATTSS